MIESCQRVQMTSLTLLKMFFVAKTTYWSWYASILKTCKSPLIFVNEGAKINLNFYIKKILTPALVEMKKHFGKKNLHFNKMVPPLTPQTNVRSGVKVTFHHFGVRKCGLLHLLIWFLWTTTIGQYLRRRPVLLPTKILRISRYLFFSKYT